MTELSNAIRVNCCDAVFGGALACHCSACHRTFTSPSGFTAHRKNGECVDPQDLGMVKADRKWDGWQMPGTYVPEDAA